MIKRTIFIALAVFSTAACAPPMQPTAEQQAEIDRLRFNCAQYKDCDEYRTALININNSTYGQPASPQPAPDPERDRRMALAFLNGVQAYNQQRAIQQADRPLIINTQTNCNGTQCMTTGIIN